ncbi:MAG: SOUL family heme-binding protein [Gammaproteobacteria bacterium]
MKITAKIAALTLLILNTAMAVEEASYEIVLTEGQFEIREYAPQVVAQVVVATEMEDAGSAAFKPLFDYISGANQTNQEIAMTAPVAQQRRGEKIAMTAPVAQQSNGDSWVVSFMMPAGRTLENLPAPTNSLVEIREVPARQVATVRYSGFWSEKRYRKFKRELEAWLETKQLTATGDPIWARYDPPFKPWFMRRNEILIPLASAPAPKS